MTVKLSSLVIWSASQAGFSPFTTQTLYCALIKKEMMEKISEVIMDSQRISTWERFSGIIPDPTSLKVWNPVGLNHDPENPKV
jgi:hypothetical protein